MSIEAIPVWAFFVVTIVIVVVSIEVGYRLGCFARQRSTDEKESPISVMSQSILGLAAFMLAFTFGIVANRFEVRKELVREEANAIQTASLRADFLSESDRAETQGLMRRYVNERVALYQSQDTQRVESFLAEAQRSHGRLWEIAVANARKDLNSHVAALYIDSLNTVFDIHSLRVAQGLQVRIPTGIWLMLLALMVLGTVGVGYQTGIAGSKRSMARLVLAVSFALVISLIADLDRPGGGSIRVTHQPLIDLQSWISEGSRVAGPKE